MYFFRRLGRVLLSCFGSWQGSLGSLSDFVFSTQKENCLLTVERLARWFQLIDLTYGERNETKACFGSLQFLENL